MLCHQVAQKTANKITNMISPDMLNSETRLVLVNAMYFKVRQQKTNETMLKQIKTVNLNYFDRSCEGVLDDVLRRLQTQFSVHQTFELSICKECFQFKVLHTLSIDFTSFL